MGTLQRHLVEETLMGKGVGTWGKSRLPSQLTLWYQEEVAQGI